ncbi:AMP-binding protein [Streptomyces antarcticus]|uniref:AMP-binding protein n=1 Tax=Streptomyces antarcticus TaxID=2996458 RepID=UPI00226FD7D2|nr:MULTISPECIES: AMP-binding protein [unclassified Streptomyces]MCY0947575.1 AMP-binding protein [Streptomyces sp. H34-AA3]MCZ4086985.1 AMP-binding protein [Streptomyces sp. H34-S5]
MNATPDHPELDQLSADVAGLLGGIGLDPADGWPARRHRIDIRFAASAARHPGRVAARDAEGQATYLELEWLADDIARRLSGRSGPGGAVAVRVLRSCEAAAAVVGVLRAGAAVLPLEPGHNAGLQEFLMRDAGAGMVVSDSGLLRDEIPVAKAGRFVIAVRPQAVVRREIAPQAAFLALPQGGAPGRAAAVRPVSHLDVLSWVDGCVPVLGVGPQDVWSCFHSLSLDLGMREMWGPLLSGGCAVMVDRDTAGEAGGFARLLAERRVTVLTQLPSAFARLAAAARPGSLPALRHVLLADEPVDARVVDGWRSAGIAPRAVVRDVSGAATVL